jgi:crotonobetainyl-CoA:carnitine CoA-transferase CaiB-like acyl-CoA transferase
MTSPLAGVRVVEVGQNLAGPVAAQILGHLGADVIKVEKPDGGDDARAWGPPFVDGASLSHHTVNHNKRSVALDLRREEDMARLRWLIADADVFVHNLRPGAAEAIGLDGPTLLGANPRLVYCGISAFGETGPLHMKPGYEILIQAFAGLMSVTGTPDGPPVRMGTSVIDFGTGMWTALAALAALRVREQTGRGVIVSTSLLETGLYWLARQFAEFKVKGEPPERHATGSPRLVGFQAFETANGPIVIAPGNDRLFARFAAALGHPEWATDPRFRTTSDRGRHRDYLLREMQAVLRTGTVERWMDALEAAGVPCAPILTVPEVLEQPQTQALGMLQTIPESGVDVIGLPLRFDGVRPPVRRPAPRVGEHNREVLGGE